jgi:hypothetical protein
VCSRRSDAGFDHHRCSGLRAETAQVGNSTLPTHACRGPVALANQAVVTRNGPHPLVELAPLPPGASIVVLAGRATHVPQAAGTNGIQRTATVTPTSPVARGIRL